MNTDCQHEPNLASAEIDDILLEETVSILTAMSDTARLKILLLLNQEGELCVSEIADMLNGKVNTISMRLKKLYDAKLVSKRRQAKHIYYRIKDDHIVTIIHNSMAHVKHQ